MSDIRTLNYEGLTDQEAFDLWLSECPVDYNWQGDDFADEDSMYEIYAFRLEGLIPISPTFKEEE